MKAFKLALLFVVVPLAIYFALPYVTWILWGALVSALIFSTK